VSLITARSNCKPEEKTAWAPAVHEELTTLLADIDDLAVAQAWRVLLGLYPDHLVDPGPVNVRRVQAMKEFRPGKEQSADTFRKVYEHSRCWPPLIKVLNDRLAGTEGQPAVTSPTTTTDVTPARTRSAHLRLNQAEDLILLAKKQLEHSQLQQAESLLVRAVQLCPRDDNDQRLMLLHVDILMTYADVHRDRGELSDALVDYERAATMAGKAGRPRAVALAELYATVVKEMRWRTGDDRRELQEVAAAYQAFSDDEYLGAVYRHRAALWAGSAVWKLGQPKEAVDLISGARQWLLDAGYDFVGTHTKLAAATLSLHGPDAAHKVLSSLDEYMPLVSRVPLQTLRLDVARVRIQLSQPRQRVDGLTELQRLVREAHTGGYGHQERLLRSLQTKYSRTGSRS